MIKPAYAVLYNLFAAKHRRRRNDERILNYGINKKNARSNEY